MIDIIKNGSDANVAMLSTFGYFWSCSKPTHNLVNPN